MRDYPWDVNTQITRSLQYQTVSEIYYTATIRVIREEYIQLLFHKPKFYPHSCFLSLIYKVITFLYENPNIDCIPTLVRHICYH